MKMNLWKKLQILLIGLVLLGNGCISDTTSYQSKTIPSSLNQPVNYPAQEKVYPTRAHLQKITTDTSIQTDGLSNDNHYTNTYGNTVHSPAYEAQPNIVPSGASARCRDGTYSFSQSRRGTCSHHEGVSEWL